MREFIKSVNSYSWAMSLYGLKQMENLFSSNNAGDRSPASKSIEEITEATRRQLGPTLDSIFRTGDALQRMATDATLFLMFPALMMMSPGSGDQSANRETGDKGEQADRNAAYEESGATPIRNTREAAGSGRKR